MQIITWAILGLIAGAIAKVVYPGNRDGGILATIALGITGSFVGGFLGQKFLGIGVSGSLTPDGIITAVVGAIFISFLWSQIWQFFKAGY